MFFDYFKKTKYYPKDIVLFCTPRSGSHYYLTEFFSKFVIDENLSYQIESGELFNTYLPVWFNPRTKRIWCTNYKNDDESDEYIKTYAYKKLSNDLDERIDQVEYYKKKYKLSLIYSIHPNHILKGNNLSVSAMSFLKKQHIFGLQRNNKVGQVFSWLKYTESLEEGKDSAASINIDWIINEIVNYEKLKKDLPVQFEISYEQLNLPDSIKEFIKSNSRKKLLAKKTSEKISIYPKLPSIDYKENKFFFKILSELQNKKLLNISEKKKRVLILGLPGSGKTTFSILLAEKIREISKKTVENINADYVRNWACDYDFTEAGRIRQSIRMFDLSWFSEAEYVICDFIAPLDKSREIFNADFTIFMDTINSGRYEDTNQIFSIPQKYDVRIPDFKFDAYVENVANMILENKKIVFNNNYPSTQIHSSIEILLGLNEEFYNNLFIDHDQVFFTITTTDLDENSRRRMRNLLDRKLDIKYRGKYEISFVPNIVKLIHIDNKEIFKKYY